MRVDLPSVKHQRPSPLVEQAPSLPLVTVIMPVRNEARYIRHSLGAVLTQDYPPERMQVLVVDGMSEDGTREIVQSVVDAARLTAGDRQLACVLLDNPSRVAPAALNVGLQHAEGEVIIRVDGHCEVATDYARRCVQVLKDTCADCVGGPTVAVGESRVARSVALAQNSFFGAGGAAFRTKLNWRGYVDTVAFGAYRRQVFARIGGFDEELVRDQDDEFNFRLIQAGGRIWLDPSIRHVYHCRAGLLEHYRQYFEYGFYKVRVIQKRRGVAAWRHLAPATFVLALLGSLMIALLGRQPLAALSVIGPYIAANLLATLWVGRRDWMALPVLPVAFAATHFAYGLGFLSGIWYWRGRRDGHDRSKT